MPSCARLFFALILSRFPPHAHAFAGAAQHKGFGRVNLVPLLQASVCLCEPSADMLLQGIDTVSVSSQVVLCVGSMFWTQEVAEAIKGNTLQDYSKQCTADLLEVNPMLKAGLHPATVQQLQQALQHPYTMNLHL